MHYLWRHGASMFSGAATIAFIYWDNKQPRKKKRPPALHVQIDVKFLKFTDSKGTK